MGERVGSVGGMPAQSNSVTASFFFIAVLVADCLTAIDSTDHADVPSSLRATCISLLCCFAAPVLIRPERGIYGWLQRPVIRQRAAGRRAHRRAPRRVGDPHL